MNAQEGHRKGALRIRAAMPLHSPYTAAAEAAGAGDFEEGVAIDVGSELGYNNGILCFPHLKH